MYVERAMGRAATQQEMEGTGEITIPLSLGNSEMDDPSFDLIGGDEEDKNPEVTASLERNERMEASSLKDKEFLSLPIQTSKVEL